MEEEKGNGYMGRKIKLGGEIVESKETRLTRAWKEMKESVSPKYVNKSQFRKCQKQKPKWAYDTVNPFQPLCGIYPAQFNWK